MTAVKPPFAIHWFRRDLRIAGNPALQTSFKQTRGRVLGLFCFDRSFLARPDFSQNRFGFFLKTLAALREELRAAGGDLLVLDDAPDEVFENLIRTLGAQGVKPALISFNRDYEPFARARDARIEKLILAHGIELSTDRDHVLIEPDELRKPGTLSNAPGSTYQIYTPFSKRWFEIFQSDEVQSRIRTQKAGLRYLQSQLDGQKMENIFHLTWADVLGPTHQLPPFCDQLDTYLARILKQVTIPLPNAGSLTAYRRLQQFTAEKCAAYPVARDIPSEPGTSEISIYLKNGSLTIAQVIAELGDALGMSKPTHYLKELIWREFYYHILYHRPDVEHSAFQARYNKIPWSNNETLFQAWKDGETGYPIVDAGMRQLRASGWMHNRVRMIVASFLTKDLLVSWQWGERYFMETLLDGDLAPNNGGWQWAASTGCDAQPYFRIFNPRLQSERFDPDGTYIKRWVPELAHLPPKTIHAPPPTPGYPAPIVDHAAQKPKALALFKNIG